MKKVQKTAIEDEPVGKELETLKQERGKTGNYIEGLKQKSPQQPIDTSGPMVRWGDSSGTMRALN